MVLVPRTLLLYVYVENMRALYITLYINPLADFWDEFSFGIHDLISEKSCKLFLNYLDPI